MLSEIPFTKENLDTCLSELAKEFRGLNGKNMSAEIILIGGAAVLAKYSFRKMTYDIDATVLASSAMKEAINRVGDRLGLPNGWLNTNFRKTQSYSDKLIGVSTYYKTFSNILEVRTITAEYLIAMKLMSGRQYKNDMSDIAGILWEHQKSGKPITREAVQSAVCELYGDWSKLPEFSKAFFGNILPITDYEALYRQSRDSEKLSKEILLDFEQKYPDTLNAGNIDDIISKAKSKLESSGEKSASPPSIGRDGEHAHGGGVATRLAAANKEYAEREARRIKEPEPGKHKAPPER
jgi:hypothetical protein